MGILVAAMLTAMAMLQVIYMFDRRPGARIISEAIVELVRRVRLGMARQRAKNSARGRLNAPPGHLLLRFGEFFYSRKQFDEELQPTIQDMREEYNEALDADRRMKARWVRIRGTWSFFKAAGLTKLWGAVKTIRKIVTK